MAEPWGGRTSHPFRRAAGNFGLRGQSEAATSLWLKSRQFRAWKRTIAAALEAVCKDLAQSKWLLVRAKSMGLAGCFKSSSAGNYTASSPGIS